MDEISDRKKKHNKSHSGRKADKKKKKDEKSNDSENAKERNPKAFAVQAHVKAERRFRRVMDIKSKRQQLPTVDRSPLEPPPVIVAVVGPPKVGKTTVIRCLIKNFTKRNVTSVQGPVTLVSGKKRRLTLLECNNDINVMIDIAKIADLVLLLIDAKFGFEMETFEFLNICQVHGFPRILGVLTHLDLLKNTKQLRSTKKELKHRFWTEVYQGAKLFYLSGMIHDEYQKTEIHNLARFISVIKFRPLQWRTNHPYILADRVEDVTDPELIRKNPKCDREISLYGYVRGTYFKDKSNVHIPGCGDFNVKEISYLLDPCPLPDKEKRRSLNEKEKLIFAPMSGVGGIIYDKDAVYIDLGGSHSHLSKNLKEDEKTDKQLTSSLMAMQTTVDVKLSESRIQVFKNAPEIGLENIDEDEENDDESDFSDESSDESEVVGKKMKFDDENEDDEIGNLKWKENLAVKASDLYYKHQRVSQNVQKLVYGKEIEKEDRKGLDESDEDEIEDLFHVVRDKSRNVSYRNWTMNDEDCSKFVVGNIRDWSLAVIRDSIRDCFVTGKWLQDEDARKLLQTENDDEESLYDHFEDLETGTIHTPTKTKTPPEPEEKRKTEPKTLEEKRMEKKRKLKELFDGEYDDKSGGSAYLNELKTEMDTQTQLNRSEFDDLPDDLRVQYEGFRPGMYVRVFLDNIPCELITNFDPTYPIILGGLLSAEENIGFVQVRMKKHRWYKRILKTRDPLIISLGWRRFQTMVLYSHIEHNNRNRLIKYTPEHLHCTASFWGPITPQNTGLLAIQSISETTPDFRIAATGVILNLDKSTEIVKKLKLIGEPSKIYKKTSFITGMFTSSLEVAKYEGAAIKTVSGIRGQIKKALKTPQGAFRATFEDKIKMSDLIFMRTWVTVEVPKFFNPVTSLLLTPEMKCKWQGMRTIGQLKYELGIKNIVNQDSLYKPIQRVEKVFNTLKIPKSLQKNLPYAFKPKFSALNDRKFSLNKQRIAVVREPHEEKVARLMKTIKGMYAVRKVKERNAMSKRVIKHRKDVKKQEEIRTRKQKEVKREICRTLHKIEKKKLKYKSKNND